MAMECIAYKNFLLKSVCFLLINIKINEFNSIYLANQKYRNGLCNGKT